MFCYVNIYAPQINIWSLLAFIFYVIFLGVAIIFGIHYLQASFEYSKGKTRFEKFIYGNIIAVLGIDGGLMIYLASAPSGQNAFAVQAMLMIELLLLYSIYEVQVLRNIGSNTEIISKKSIKRLTLTTFALSMGIIFTVLFRYSFILLIVLPYIQADNLNLLGIFAICFSFIYSISLSSFGRTLRIY